MPKRRPCELDPLRRCWRVALVAGFLVLDFIGCTQQLVWPKEPLHVVIDEALDGGAVPIGLVSSKTVVAIEDTHHIDPGCTRAFPYRSFAKGLLSEKSKPNPFTFAARQGFVYQLELISGDGGPTPQVQFSDGEYPIPTPSAGGFFDNGLSVKVTGPGSVYLRASTCGH